MLVQRPWRRALGPWTYGGPVERIALLVGLAGAALLVVSTPNPLQLCLTGPPLRQVGAGLSASLQTGLLAQSLLHMGLMTLAMAAPLARHGLAHAWFSAFPWRRRRAVLAYSVAYSLPWLVGGLIGALIMAAAALADPGVARWGGAAAAVAAGLWHACADRRPVLARSHRREPLPAGSRGDVACLSLGLRQGLWCATACGPLMLALCFNAAPAFVLAGTWLSILERERFPRPLGGLFGVYFAALAASPWLSA